MNLRERFDRLYAERPDPWDFETSAYEHAKYDATLAALDDRRYATGLEVGCSMTVVLPQPVIEQLWEMVEADPATEITVDLVNREVRAKDIVEPFELDDYTRWRFMEGLDDIGITLSHEDDIETHEAARPSWKPATL